jgi:hypothetical protein
MDLGLNNNIVHSNVKTNITLDRGMLITITPDIHDLGIQPTICGVIDSQRYQANAESYHIPILWIDA